ncbi:hypothetical protein FNV43_RR17504 [Rhamnella rubrinervis]|uniref:Uncharacterized protein n=1 Tax=Rhamnella rubrinervis TaxID=2594499 RepID=A0A8K0E3U3_9ROSA|nr:hypothetical protein FNV43_RR17504 [Rhamnella rubrinervis]
MDNVNIFNFFFYAVKLRVPNKLTTASGKFTPPMGITHAMLLKSAFLSNSHELLVNNFQSLNEGLSARPLATSDEIQLRIDPLQGDLDDQLTGLHSQVRRLKSVAQEIEAETRVQNDIISDLVSLLLGFWVQGYEMN